MNYVPVPIDTSNVELSDDLLELSESLSKNNHEVWARERIAEGWTYGPMRDDTRKEHPSLIPYEELSDAERNYDQVMVSEMLKAISTLGFRVEKNR